MQTPQTRPTPLVVQRRPGLITLDHLLVATMLVLIWLFISVLPLPPNDLWWHMAAGRTMVAEGALMTDNRWAYTVPYDTPYPFQSWLGEVVLYLTWRVGDVPLLALLRTLAIVTSYGLVAWAAWRRCAGNGKAVALAVLVAMMIGWGNWTLRPQTLAFVPGAVMIALLSEYAAGRLAPRWLVALPALIALWVNLHGSFSFGLILMALTWLGMLITTARTPWAEGAEARRRVAALTLAGAASGLAAIVHPFGLGIFGYVRGMVGNEIFREYILEWQRMEVSTSPISVGFWYFATVLGIAVLMATGRRRPTAVDLVWYCGLAWLAADAVRHAIWFGLALAPLLAALLDERLGGPSAPAPRPVALGYGAVLAAVMLATLPWLGPGRYLGPGGEAIYAATGPHRLLLSNITPVGASEWLAQHPIEGRFWTDQSYTSYTIWRLPEKQVFTDLRYELFPREVWEDYYAISKGDAQSLAAIERWQITHLLVDKNFQRELLALLRATPGWCERYDDASSSVIARCDGA